MNKLDPIAVAHGLLTTADVCDAGQLALRERLLQGARVILQQHQLITKLQVAKETETTDESIPMFLRPQAD